MGPASAGRRCARVCDQGGVPPLHPLEPGLGRAERRGAGAGRPAAEGEVDQTALLFDAAVEEREPAVAVPEEAQRGREPADCFREHRPGRVLTRIEGRAQPGEAPERRQLHRGVSLRVASVAQYLSRQRRFEELETLGDAALALGQAQPALDQSPVRDQLRQSLRCIARRARQVVGLELEPLAKAPGEFIVGALQQKLAVSEPGREALPKRLGPPHRSRRALNRAMLPQPVEHHRAAALRRPDAARCAQVAQPGEAVKIGEPEFTGGPVTPRRVAALSDLFGVHRLTAEFIEASGQVLAAAGDARHEINRPVQQLRHLAACTAPESMPTEPSQGAGKAAQGSLAPRTHGTRVGLGSCRADRARSCAGAERVSAPRLPRGSQSRNIAGIVGLPASEACGTRDQHVGAGGCGRTGGVLVDPAITERSTARPLASIRALSASILPSWLGMKRWPPNPGVDGHHQHEIDIGEHRLDGVDRCGRVECDAGALAGALDALERPVQMSARLGVDGDAIGTGIGEGLDVGIDRRDHQVNVEGAIAMGPERRNDTRADGQVGYEVPVHHVDVQPVSTGIRDRSHLLAKARKVGRQD